MMPHSPPHMLDRLHMASDYHLRHLAYHLAQAQQGERLHQLLTGSDLWLRAKFERFTDDTAYADDLTLALQRHVDPPIAEMQIVQMLALWTARVVIRQRNRFVGERDLVTLVWLGKTHEALNAARLQGSAPQIYQGLWTVYKTLKKRGHVDQAVLEELQQVAIQIEEDEARAEAYADIVYEYVQLNEFERVEQLLPAIRQSGWQLAGQLALAQLYFRRGAQEMAHLLVQQVEHACTEDTDTYTRVGILTAVAALWHEMGAFEHAQAIFQTTQRTIEQIADPQSAVMARCVFASGLAEVQQTSWAQAIFTDAIGLVRQIELLTMREFTLELLLDKALAAGLAGLHTDIIQAMHYPWMRMAAHCTVASAMARDGAKAQAQALLMTVQNNLPALEEADQAFVYTKVATVCATLEDWSGAQQALAHITPGQLHRETLAQLAFIAATTQQAQRASELYAQYRALPVAQPITWRRVQALCAVALELAARGDKQQASLMLQAAITATQQLTDLAQQTKAIHELVGALFPLAGLSAVWQVAVEMPERHTDILLALAAQLTPDEAVATFPLIEQQLKFGTQQAELCGLWALALTRRDELAHAQARIEQLVAIHEQLMTVLTAASAATTEPLKLDELFSRLLCLEANVQCAVAEAYFHKGDPVNAAVPLQELTKRLASIHKASILVAPVANLARTLHRLNLHAQADNLIQCLYRLAAAMQAQEQRDQALQILAEYYLAVGQRAQVQPLIDRMDRTANPAQRVLAARVADFVAQGEPELARQTLTQITDAAIQLEASQGLAVQLWQSGAVSKALALYQAVTVDEYIGCVAHLLRFHAAGCQSHGQEIGVQTLWQTMKIAGWVEATWQHLAQNRPDLQDREVQRAISTELNHQS